MIKSQLDTQISCRGYQEINPLDPSKKNLLLIHPFYGIREIKIAYALRKYYNLICLSSENPYKKNKLPRLPFDKIIWGVENVEDTLSLLLKKWKIKAAFAFDVLPFTEKICKLLKKMPIIFDIQDSFAIYELDGWTSKSSSNSFFLEKSLVERAEILVSISKPTTEELKKHYRISSSIELPCLSTTEFRPNTILNKLSSSDGELHLVYQGGLAGSDGKSWSVKYLCNVFKQFIDSGIHIHCYSPSPNNLSDYFKLDRRYFHFHSPVTPDSTLSTLLTQYDYSLCVFNSSMKKSKVLEIGFPNKLADSILSKVPVIADSRTPIINSFIEENNCGIVAKNIEELIKKIKMTSPPKVDEKAVSAATFEDQIIFLVQEIDKLIKTSSKQSSER